MSEGLATFGTESLWSPKKGSQKSSGPSLQMSLSLRSSASLHLPSQPQSPSTPPAQRTPSALLAAAGDSSDFSFALRSSSQLPGVVLLPCMSPKRACAWRLLTMGTTRLAVSSCLALACCARPQLQSPRPSIQPHGSLTPCTYASRLYSFTACTKAQGQPLVYNAARQVLMQLNLEKRWMCLRRRCR